MNVKIFGEGVGRVGVREIVPGVYWISHCLGDHAPQWMEVFNNQSEIMRKRRVDIQFSAFLIVDEKSVLLDTLGPNQRTHLMEALDYTLNKKSLDYVWVSHTELPHAGNALALKQRYGSKIIAAKGGDHYMVHGLEDAMLAAPGDRIKLGRAVLQMVDPLFVDHGLTQWVYEERSGLLCTVDWGHNFHVTPTECFQFLDEMRESIPFLQEDIIINMRTQFPWLAWTNPEETNRAIDAAYFDAMFEYSRQYTRHLFETTCPSMLNC